MQREMITTELLGRVDYMPLPDGRADIFIYQFLEEITDTDGNISFKYMMNEFRTSKLSKEEVEANPMKYMDYDEKAETLEETVRKLKTKVEGLTFILSHITENVQEVIKEDNSDLPSGDYLNPIYIPDDGITTVKGLFYYTDDKILPHEALQDAFVTREDYDDRVWFDYI